MATSTQLRSSLRGLTNLAATDLAVLWRGIDTPTAAETALRDVLPALIDTYGAAAASIAADWYDDRRDEKAVRGRFRAIPAEIADSGAQPLVGWALSEARDVPGFTALILGGTQRRIANYSRFTITASAVQDPSAGGWVRVGEGACKSGWCDQYLDGEIRTVPYDFPAHDNCHCHAQPAW